MKFGKSPRRSETTQIHPRISKALAPELKLEARRRRTSKSDIVDAALKTFLNQTEHESVIDRRLNNLQEQLERITREQKMLLETLATFIKVYLAHTAEFPEAQKPLLEEKGLKRFEKFMGLLAHTFDNETLFGEAIKERIMNQKDFTNKIDGKRTK